MSQSSEEALPDVSHVVVVMFENRSFDNIFGWAYSSLRPPHFIPYGPNKRFNGLQGYDLSRLANPVTLNGVTSWLPPKRGFSTTTIGQVEYLMPPPVDPNEEFDHMTRQIYGPWTPRRPAPGADGNLPRGSTATMKGFAEDYAGQLGANPTLDQISRVMECGTGAQTYPFHLLAYAYAVSDAWFGACPTQTNPNRAFMACGTSQGKVNNGSLGFDDFTAPTVWNRLEEHGVSWKVYWENTFLPETGSQPWTRQCFSQIKNLSDDHFPRISAFHRDARLGKLPFFSFIEPSWTLEQDQEGFQGNDLHPPGDIRPGLQLLSSIYTSLASNPAAWAKTVLLVTFDEHGGTYDHVPPPETATPDFPHPSGFRFDRFGPRVPTMLISPMVEPGTVFRSLKGLDTPYDHTSIPATVLKLAKIPKASWNLYARVDAAPTFEGVLTRAKNPRTEVRLGTPGGDWETPPDAPGVAAVSFGDPFLLRYASAGPFKDLYVTSDDTNDGTYPWLTSDRTKARRFRFTMGYSTDPARPVGMNVRTPAAVHLQWAASWGPDAQNTAYVRVPDNSVEEATWCVFGQDDQWWYSAWYVSHPSRSLLAWQIQWGDEVLIEYHALNANTLWLPRKMIVRNDWDGNPYLAVGDDSDYDDVTVGHWVIERP